MHFALAGDPDIQSSLHLPSGQLHDEIWVHASAAGCGDLLPDDYRHLLDAQIFEIGLNEI